MTDFSRRCIATEGTGWQPIIAEALDSLGFKAFILSIDPATDEKRMVGIFDRGLLRRVVAHSAYLSDPVMKGARDSALPVFWEASAYLDRRLAFARLFEMALDFGYERGAALRVTMACGRRATLAGVYRHSARQMGARQIELSNALIVIGAYAGQAYALPPERDAPRLSPREILCLHWAAKGKTAWETAQLLSIRERTVNFHLQNAMATLQAGNKLRAAIVAMKRGLI